MSWTRSKKDNRPAAVIIGGRCGGISVARSLWRQGIKVYALNYSDQCLRYSRCCEFIHLQDDADGSHAWTRFLLSEQSDYLRGAVLLTCDDYAVEMIVRNFDKLSEKFVVEAGGAELRRSLLDKLWTYKKAQEVGISVPNYWPAESLCDLQALEGTARFPLILKPIISHKFQRRYNKKHIRIENMDELHKEYGSVRRNNLDVFLVEFIPGEDDKLCSYYTYIDESGRPLVHFTKRVIRRYPPNMGGACYHITDWVPEAKELGLKFFNHVQLRGLGNVEFKLDERDGKLKLIECNARFTAADCLVAASGVDFATISYNQLTREKSQIPTTFRTQLRLWEPAPDILSFLELRKLGRITFWDWLRSIRRPFILPYLRWYDPWPTLVMEFQRLIRFLRRQLGMSVEIRY